MVIDKEIASSQMPKIIDGAKNCSFKCQDGIEKTEFDAKINIEVQIKCKLSSTKKNGLLKEMGYLGYKGRSQCVFCEKGIDDMVLHFLGKAGVLAVKSVSSSDIEKLSKATGAQIVANVKDIRADVLGKAKRV